MKRIIQNKVYNSETAKKIGMVWLGSEFDRTGWEELYRKKTGNFFLLTHRYSDQSEYITPLSYEAAQAWAESNLVADDYIEIFGNPEEETRTKINVCMSAAQAAKIRQLAAKENMSLADYILSRVLDE